jgi:hypothetical protein
VRATKEAGQVRSNHTAQLDFNGGVETPDEFAVLSYTFDTVPTAAGRPYAMRPQSVFGPAGTPHYGVGGFHEFIPVKYTFQQPATLTMFYRDDEVVDIDENTLAIYRWNNERRDWDLLGGVQNTGANTVTTTIDRTGLYTLAPSMPAGTFTYTVQATPSGDAFNPKTIVTYTSTTVAVNTGGAVPDGTMFTVATVDTAADAVPIGSMLTVDEDPIAAGVQVSAHGGVIQFAVEFSGPVDLATAVAFSNRGTALGVQPLPIRP